MRVIPSQTTAWGGGKGSPLTLRPELGSHGSGHACPLPVMMGIEFTTECPAPICPPVLFTTACQINDHTPIFQLRQTQKASVSLSKITVQVAELGAQAWLLVLATPSWC